uniref:Uncharacterized protein n=1 Tax=Cyprinus carpio TaxID=7962 RepID=A0A8C1WWL2_CYPCA
MHAIGQITFQSLPLTGMKTKGKRSQNPDISLSLEIGKNRTYSHPTKEGDFIQSFLYTKWFRMRNAQWRKAEGLPAELGSVKD